MMFELLFFYIGCGMAKRGRPSKLFDDSELTRIIGFATRMTFRTKAQQQLYDLENSRIITSSSLDDELLALIKIVDRQRNNYRRDKELYKIIQHKATTSIPLSDLESEILAYDLTDRDGFFSCHRALKTYQKLEKITKSEIERKQSEQWQEKIKKGKENQSDAQKKRIAENKRKYFLGGVLQKYVAFLKVHHLVDDVSDEEVLTALAENTVISQFLSHVTDADENRAINVRNRIKSKHVDLLNALNGVAQEVAQDKRKG